MNVNMALGLLLPFAATTLGASCVFFMKDKMNVFLEKVLLGFAGGVMIAASVWSLLLPSMEMSEDLGVGKVIPAVVGMMLGVFVILMIDQFTPHLHLNEKDPEGVKSSLKKTTMMFLAVTIHNFPEGMVVGVVFAGLKHSNVITLTSAFALSLGIAIQNIPEGAIVSMPLKAEGKTKLQAFLYGTLSGAVEPIGALLTIYLSELFVPILPYMLAFAAGAMIYVVVEELIPEASVGKHSNIATIGFTIGFCVMMVLDVVLS